MTHETPSAPAPFAAPVRRWSSEVLERELGRVHAREFARLLCRAALLRLDSRPGLSAQLRALGLEDEPASWRHAAQHARRLAAIDGYEPGALLRHALGHARSEWAPAASLVREALALEPAEDVRWHAVALDWFEGRSGARALLVSFAGNAASEVWRARARILLAQGEQAPW